MSEPSNHPSRFSRFIVGASHGAKFGALAGFVIGLLIYIVCFAIALLDPTVRTLEFGDMKHAIFAIGVSIGMVGMIALYGAMIGAVIMGLASLRQRQPL